ncbi:peptide chain release factor N(5)-glutamine methyltransferase [Mycolicibacterium thermoresistibile]
MTGMRQVIDAAALTLTAAGVNSPRTDALELAAFAAGVDRGRLLLIDVPDEAFVDRYRGLVAARAQRIPLQHLTGSAAFGPVTLAVGPGVFIPRPETEALLEWAMRQPLPGAEHPVIVDLCTGSGALAVALHRHRPAARIIAVDAADEALSYARRNTAGTGIEVRKADVTAPQLLCDLTGQVDLIVANPPYIPAVADLEPEVAQHDPPDALFGGPDGMAVITAIVHRAADLLRPGGRCAIEHDDTTAAQTVAAFTDTGRFGDVTARCDLAGRPRFVTATRLCSGHQEGLTR